MKTKPSETAALTKILETLDSLSSTEPFPSDLLQIIAETFGCNLAVHWHLNDNGKSLRFKEVWIDQNHIDLINNEVKKRRFSSGEGMPGKTWRSMEPAISNDLVTDMMLPRSIILSNEGFKHGLWIPMQTKSKCIGVIELLSKQAPNLPEAYESVLRVLGMELGAKFDQETSQ